GNKPTWQTPLLQDRVASVRDDEPVVAGQFGTAIGIFRSDQGQPRDDVNGSEHLRELLDSGRGCRRNPPQGVEQLKLEGPNPFFCAQDFVFERFEFLGGKPLRIDESLSASVMQGNSIQVRLGDLDVIPEYLVIADFQRLDARLLALLALDSSDPGFPIPADNSQFVKRSIVPITNEPSFFDRRWRIRLKGVLNGHRQFGEVIPLLMELF